MKKLFGNRFSLISYLVIILIFITNLTIDFSNTSSNYIDWIDYIYFGLIFLSLGWIIYFSILNIKNSTTKRFLSILVPITPLFFLSHFEILYNNFNDINYPNIIFLFISLSIIIILIQYGIVFKWNLYFYSVIAFFLGLIFKSGYIPGADLLLMSSGLFIFLKLIFELIFLKKSNVNSIEYKKLFVIFNLGFLAVFASTLFIFFHFGDQIFGKFLNYLFYVFIIIGMLLLPKSDYYKWDQKLKRRFKINIVYMGIFFFLLSSVFMLSDIIGYDITNLVEENYFP